MRVHAGRRMVLGGLAALLWACSQPSDQNEPAAVRGAPALGRGVDDAVLVDMTGKSVAWRDLKGTPRALFFGFTRCPDICPTTIGDLSAAIERVGPAARALRVDFVSVDPARDTASVLAAYLGAFGPQFVGYTGEEATLVRLAGAYRAAFRQTPLDGGDYTIDHTTAVYLIDARGQVRDVVAFQTPPEKLDAQLRAFLSE